MSSIKKAPLVLAAFLLFLFLYDFAVPHPRIDSFLISMVLFWTPLIALLLVVAAGASLIDRSRDWSVWSLLLLSGLVAGSISAAYLGISSESFKDTVALAALASFWAVAVDLVGHQRVFLKLR